MAVLIFYVPSDKLKEAKKILEADPYAEDSFSRVGYKLREGKSLGIGDDDGYYIYIRSENAAFLDKAKERLSGAAELFEGEKAESVKNKIEEEEAAAAKGFGDIFG